MHSVLLARVYAIGGRQMGGAGSAYCSRRAISNFACWDFVCHQPQGDAPQRHFFATGESVLIQRARMHTS